MDSLAFFKPRSNSSPAFAPAYEKILCAWLAIHAAVSAPSAAARGEESAALRLVEDGSSEIPHIVHRMVMLLDWTIPTGAAIPAVEGELPDQPFTPAGKPEFPLFEQASDQQIGRASCRERV